MGFFLNEARKAPASPSQGPKRPAKGAHIPVEAMRSLSCKVCPLGGSDWPRSPKMEPTGPGSADVAVLWSAPSREDDDAGEWARGPAGDIVKHYLRQSGIKAVHLGMTQCGSQRYDDAMGGPNPEVAVVECCRGRVWEDFKRLRPRLVYAVGDAALWWLIPALREIGGALTFRGSLMPAKIAGEDLWVMPLAYPNFVNKKKSKRTSEYELALRHDIDLGARLLELRQEPEVITSGQLKEVEIITGQEAGDFQRLEDALNFFAGQCDPIGLDYETNALRPWHTPTYYGGPKILTAAVATEHRSVAFAMMDPRGWGADSRVRKVMGLWGEFLMQSPAKVAHNLGFELEWTNYFYGADPLRLTDWEDSMALAYVLDSRSGTKSLAAQTVRHFGFNLKSLSPGIDTKALHMASFADVLIYNAGDPLWTIRVFNRQLQSLLTDYRPEEAEALIRVYDRKVRLSPTLVRTQAKGVPIDRDYADALQAEYEGKAADALAKIARCEEVKAYEKRFGRFSATNPDHVLKLLETICKRDEVIKEDPRDGTITKTTDNDALSSIPEDEVPSAALILQHRGVEKLLSTYLRPMTSGSLIAEDGRVHCQYSPLVAVTGRLNCEDPNLQNIPTRTADGRRIRGSYVAEHNGWITAMDYGQIEARVIGMASQDPKLLRYQWSDYDIHGFWATRITELHPKVKDWIVKTFGIDWDEKGHKTLRQETKNKWVFPQFFGASVHSCAQDLHLPEDVTEKLKREFWDEFAGVLKWQDRIVKGYEKNLYVETLGGQRRSGPMSKNEIINMPVQGTAAEIVTSAMCELSELSYELDDPELQPNLNIHDDLTSWLSDATLTDKTERIAKIMCRPRFDYICVPLLVEVKVGKRWNELKEVAVYRSDVLYQLENPYK